MEIRNPTTVHLVSGEPSDAELKAIFQYASDAVTFCNSSASMLPQGTHYAIVDHYSGKMTFVRKPAPETPAQESVR